MQKNKHKHRNRKAFQKRKSADNSGLNRFRFFHPVVIITAVSFLTLLALANIQTTQNLTANVQGSVLGKDKNNDEGGSKEEKKEEEKKEEKKQEEQRENRGSPSSTEVSPTDIDEVNNEDENEQKTELITADGQKIKTKVENGVTTKIEIRRGELKLKYKLEDGRFVLKVENETGEEVDLDENELQELEDQTENELGQQGVAIAPVEGNTVAVTKNQVAATTDFPLSIDVGTNQLILTTPDGPRVVTVLPDQAVQNLLTTGIINRVEPQTADTTVQTQLGAFTGVVKLEIRNNDIVYKVNGVKTHRMLGFIPVNTGTTAFVSANSGTVVAQQRSLLANVVDFLSP